MKYMIIVYVIALDHKLMKAVNKIGHKIICQAFKGFDWYQIHKWDFASFFQILFSEFVDWALKKDLDLEDDIDVEIPDAWNCKIRFKNIV